MNTEAWRFFHDGAIEQIKGEVPGSIVLKIGISYLRRMFSSEGDGFFVRLGGCTRFDFAKYDGNSYFPVISTLLDIEAEEPERLSVRLTDPLVIVCESGLLTLAYEDIEITLDSGESLTIEQLAEASKTYWRELAPRTSQ